MKPDNIHEWIRQYFDNELSEADVAEFRLEMEENAEFAEDVQIYQIEQFIAGELEGVHLQKFEQKLQTDKSLKAELKLHQKVQEMMQKQAEEQLKSELKTIINSADNGQQGGKVVSISRRKWAFWAAAAMLFLVAGPVYFILVNQPTSGQDLFAQHFEPYDINMGLRGSSEAVDIQKLQTQAKAAYEQKNYDTAIDLLTQLSEKEPAKPDYKLYIGLSQLASDNPDLASPIFESLSTDPTFDEVAEWYLAMCYLKKEKLEMAKAKLGNIAAKSNHEFKKQAAEILEKL